MPTLLNSAAELVFPDETDTATARQSSQKLAQLLQGREAGMVRLHVHGDQNDVPVSGAALRILMQVLDEMGKGNAVTVVSVQKEFTPQKAAQFLGMSRTLLNSLLDRQEIPFRYVGSHKRVRLSDLLAFRAEQERRHQVMLELIAETEALGLYP